MSLDREDGIVGFASRASPASVPGFVVSGGALMPRSLADIDRDIGKASSQMRGALADLARLDHERRAHVATPTRVPLREWLRRLADRPGVELSTSAAEAVRRSREDNTR